MAEAIRCDCPDPDCNGTKTVRYLQGDKFGKCFRCEKNHLVSKLNNTGEGHVQPRAKGRSASTLDILQISEFETVGIPERGISKEVCEYFGVTMSYDKDGYVAAHYYPWTNASSEICSYKERKLPKTFTVIPEGAKAAQLFGQAFCDPARNKRLVVVEGETDVLAVAEASLRKYGTIYPVVGISGASSTKTLVGNLSFLRKFDEVILLLDADMAGDKANDKAARELAKVVGYDRVRIGTLTHKDPVEVLTSFAEEGQLPTEENLTQGAEALMRCVFNNHPYSPAGFLTGEKVWEAYKQRSAKRVIPYPPFLEGVNKKLKGRRDGEIVLLTSGSGCGKSTIAREIVLDELQANYADRRIGIIALESSPGEEAAAFFAMHAEVDTDEVELTEDQEAAAYQGIFEDERVILLDHQGSVSDSSLLDKIEMLCLLGCKTLLLDHITIAVSEGADGKTGNEAVDSVMSSLLKIVKKYDINLILIAHLRKAGEGGKSFEEGRMPTMDDIKGSGSIKQICFDIIGFARDTTATNEEEQTIVDLAVLKARKTGRTGPSGTCKFNRRRQRMERCDRVSETDFD